MLQSVLGGDSVKVSREKAKREYPLKKGIEKMKRTTKKVATFTLPDGLEYQNEPMLLGMGGDWLLARDGGDGRKPKKGKPAYRQPLQKMVLEQGKPYSVSMLWSEVKGLTSFATNPPAIERLESAYSAYEFPLSSAIGANPVLLLGDSVVDNQTWVLTVYLNCATWAHKAACVAAETANARNHALLKCVEEAELWFI